MANNLHRRISFGLFEFNAATGELHRQGTVVKLAPQPARVLSLLLSRPGEVILRDEFRRELWGDDTFVDFERGLNFCVTQTRAALGDSAENPRFIQTVPRRGYRFIAPVAFRGLTPNLGTGVAPETVAAPETGASARGLTPNLGTGVAPRDLTGTVPVKRGQSPWRRDSPRKWWVVSAIFVLIAGITWGAWGKRPGTRAADATIRVAVLPFANLTGDAGLDYVADGLTDEVITQLGSLSRTRLAVIARTSAMAYRTQPKPIADVARELGVQFVVEGSVRREGEGLRISSSVVPVERETAVSWVSDVFGSSRNGADAHRPAAIRIARAVAAELLPGTETDSQSIAAVHPAAVDAFMQATTSLHRGTPDDVLRALAQFETAVERDPTFAAAWARIAETHHVLAMMGITPPKDAYPAAQAAATRALGAAPDLATAHLAQGLVHLWFDGRPADAAAAFERAIGLNPSLAAAHHDYAWALVALGRTNEAIDQIQQSRDLDPISTRANNDVGWLHLFVRQPENAARACEHTLAIDPRSLEAQACLERAYAQQQQFDAALHAARATLSGREDTPPIGQGADGLREIWQWRLRQLERAAETRWINPYTLAVHYALVGDSERAIAALERAYDARVGMLTFLARDPAMDSLRGLPRFDALLTRISRTSS